MSYKALYRTYRPSQFSELVGQDAISQTLKNAIVSNRLAHAYLFCGPRGTGKTSSAKILAKTVNCLNQIDGEPCNACVNCLAAQEDKMLDIFEIDAASNRGIEDIRSLKETAYFSPSMGKYKVFIIDEVHMLTQEAFNALLKLLEEPPSHVLFILATTDPEKVPLTVLSRTQRFDFRRISDEAIKNHLKAISEREGIEVSDQALFLIANKARGGLRDAISLLDQAISFAGEQIDENAIKRIVGGLDNDDIKATLEAFFDGDYKRAFDKLEAFFADGITPRSLIASMIAYSRALLALKIGTKTTLLSESDKLSLKPFVAKLSIQDIEIVLSVFSEAERGLKYSPNAELLVEITYSRLFIALKKEPLIAPDQASESVAKAPVEEKEEKSELVPKQNQSEEVKASPSAISGSSEPKKASDAPEKEAPAPTKMHFDWEAVLDEVNNRSVRIRAILKSATEVSLEGHVLFLHFKEESAFHITSMERRENQEVLLESIKSLTGELVQIKVVVDKKENDTIVDNRLQKLYDTFGKDKVEVIKS